MELSIVVPVMNEEANVSPLHQEIKEVCETNGYRYEIIFIDDGSTDETPVRIKALHPVRLMQFRKNFGQTSAMDAGIKAAKYKYIVTMDGDRQNDPNDIPALVEYLEKNNLDVVSGWRKNRKDSFLKHFISRGANILRKILINDKIHDSGCSLKIYKKSCFKGVSLYGEMHRFIPALLSIKGFKIDEIVVNHRPRTAGKTKYNFRRTFKGLIDMISIWFWNKFSARPLHLLGGIGIFIIILAAISTLVTVCRFLLGEGMSETAWPLITVFLYLSGIHLFISGLLTDIMLKNYFESTQDHAYSIREIYDSENIMLQKEK